MTYDAPRSSMNDSQKWACLEQTIERAYRVRPAELLIGLWQGHNVKTPGLLITWQAALDNSRAVKRSGKPAVEWAFERFYSWASELADSEDLSDRWLANRVVCRVLAKCNRAPEKYLDKLDKLQFKIHERTRQIVVRDIHLAQAKFEADGY